MHVSRKEHGMAYIFAIWVCFIANIDMELIREHKRLYVVE